MTAPDEKTLFHLAKDGTVTLSPGVDPIEVIQQLIMAYHFEQAEVKRLQNLLANEVRKSFMDHRDAAQNALENLDRLIHARESPVAIKLAIPDCWSGKVTN